MIELSKELLDAAELRPAGTVLVLLASAPDPRWAADVAIELSARWAAGGRRIVLADLHLENPLLHLGLGTSNLEGVVDIFLYGASLSRIAKPVRGGTFYLIPAGTYAPDLEEIYRHPRWKKLVAGFRETEATLILFAPADSADLEALSNWSKEAIILGPGADGDLRQRLDRASMRVLTVIDDKGDGGAGAPPLPVDEVGAVSPVAPAPAGATSAESVRPSTAGGHEPGERTPEPVVERAPAVQVHRPPESELELPPPPIRRRPERRTSSILLWILFFLILLGAIGYLVATIRPDLIRRFIGAEVAPVVAASSEAPPAAPPAPTRTGEMLPYSVQVRAFPSLNAAREEIVTDQQRLESVPFFISPEAIQGIVYYRILSGLATDTTEAIRLRDHLVEIGSIDEEVAVGAWRLIEFTPLAFDLGEFPTREAAVSRADSLLQADIPTYTATVEYSDGSRRWQLYAGAYRDSASAIHMRETLAGAGIEAPLAARTGEPAILAE